MDASGMLCLMGAGLAFACGTAGARCALAACRPVAARAACSDADAGAGAGFVARCVRNGVSWAKPFARLLLGSARMRLLAARAGRVLGARGLASTDESLLSAFFAATAVLALAASVLAASPVCGIAAAGAVCLAAASGVNGAQARRCDQMREAVPDALRSMGVCFQSGLSLLQTFRQTASEVQGPLRALFEHAAHLLETGRSVPSALAALRSDDSVPELAFVSVALDVQHQAGGSMQQVLDSVRDAVKGEVELKRALRVQTAQAKLSAQVVSVLPFALVTLFSLVSDEFLAPFFTSFAGMALLGAALSMQLAGIALVRRMLAVEVA